MMEAWDRFCIPAKAAKVIPLTAAYTRLAARWSGSHRPQQSAGARARRRSDLDARY